VRGSQFLTLGMSFLSLGNWFLMFGNRAKAPRRFTESRGKGLRAARTGLVQVRRSGPPHPILSPQRGRSGNSTSQPRNFEIISFAFAGFFLHSRSAPSISGATTVASDSMTNIGVSAVNLSQVIFSLGVAPE
jgi:hypothetical protein